MKTQSPSSPFRESSGLLELVSQTSILHSDRQVHSPSCTRRLMKDVLSHDPLLVLGEHKENLPVTPRNKVNKAKRMESDDKNVLGERNVNLGETVGPVSQVEAAGVSVGETDDGGSQEKTADVKTVSPSPISQRILDLLDSIDDKDGDGVVELPPYHPVHAPFSPRPKFMRLKRTPKKNHGPNEEERPPYDPTANPLSPRPAFLRYNPRRRREFLEKVTTGKRSLAFDGREEGVQVPSADDNGAMKKSSSCPELAKQEGVEDVPPLECNPREEAEVKTDEDKARAPKLVTPGTGSIKRWCGILTRALLLCLLISAFVSGCVFLRGNLKQFQQKVMFRTWEWTAEHDEDHEVTFPGTWDTIATVSNESLMSIPESQEILVSVEDDKLIADELAESEDNVMEMEEPVSLPLEAEVEIQDTSARESLDETTLQICMDRSSKSRLVEEREDTSSLLPPPVEREADNEVTEVTETWTDTLPDGFFDIDDDTGIPLQDDLVDYETWDHQMLSMVRSCMSRTFSILQQRKNTLATLSLVGVVSALIYLLRKRRYVVAAVPPSAPPAPLAASAPAVQLLTPSAPPAPSSPATPHQDAYVISQGNCVAFSTESETRSLSRSESNSNEEQYGSFTTLVEAHGRGGRMKVTPVRRSSRLRRNNQSPMLRA